MNRLSKSDHEALRNAIAEAEARTGVHLALVVVPASDRYLTYPLAYAAFVALVLGSAWALFWPRTLVGPVVLGQAAVFVALSLIFDWLPMRLLLVPSALKRARARNLAHREFAARILTTHRGGLLLFASLAERYVELLADRALHTRVGQHVWDGIVAELARDAKNKPLCESLLRAVAACSNAVQPERQPSA